jgi:hypothetical protein
MMSKHTATNTIVTMGARTADRQMQAQLEGGKQ